MSSIHKKIKVHLFMLFLHYWNLQYNSISQIPLKFSADYSHLKIGAINSRIFSRCFCSQEENRRITSFLEEESLNPLTPPNTRVSNTFVDAVETLDLREEEGKEKGGKEEGKGRKEGEGKERGKERGRERMGGGRGVRRTEREEKKKKGRREGK
ncbi:hypothetical protein ChUKH1_15030 [Cryptosporidium hominis]|nr:hypothetical protein ChTU502y2012_407g2225 [Cryptosporidium hominis]PPA65876.1 hypothetical protein ChUKH1_15030 [Cryptosporidium hominis]